MASDRKLLLSDAGKILLGTNGQLADKNCCCGESTPFLRCDSIGASATKPEVCGFEQFLAPDPGPIIKYLKLTHMRHAPYCGGPFPPCAYGDRTIVTTIDPDTCESTVECEASCFDTDNTPGDCVTNPGACDQAWEGLFLGGSDDCIDAINHALCAVPTDYGDITAEWLLEDVHEPESTAELKSDVIDALPDYDFDFDDSCEATANLSEDETSYTIQRFLWEVVHQVPKSCYLKAWIWQRFRPEGGAEDGSDDVLTDLDPYVYDPDPDDHPPSCPLNDPDLPPDYEDNLIYSDPIEQVEPDANGTITIELKKWSCKRDYEPDDPDILGNRPDPDDNPNGPCLLHA